VKDKALGEIREQGSTTFQRSQKTGFAFDTQVNVQVGLVGPLANR
jgi:hypothetical protein